MALTTDITNTRLSQHCGEQLWAFLFLQAKYRHHLINYIFFSWSHLIVSPNPQNTIERLRQEMGNMGYSWGKELGGCRTRVTGRFFLYVLLSLTYFEPCDMNVLSSQKWINKFKERFGVSDQPQLNKPHVFWRYITGHHLGVLLFCFSCSMSQRRDIS